MGTRNAVQPSKGARNARMSTLMLDEIEELFKRQLRVWPQLAVGVQGLARAQTRRLRIEWFEVFVHHIPHRIASTTAAVDEVSVARRPCYLCSANLPPEEEGVVFNEDFTIYCNPYPIVARHLTIAHRKHCSQRIANQFGNMLDLAAALPGYFVIYNGPECGASAPDHMHFQAGSRELFPIERDTAGLTCLAVPNYCRNVFMCRERDRSAAIDRLNGAIDLLAEITSRSEPLVNIAIFHERGQWTTYLFPRGKHRPDVFYTGELMLSPASIDLCGLLVTPRAHDFETITGEAIAGIFREVTLPEAPFREVARKLERWS